MLKTWLHRKKLSMAASFLDQQHRFFQYVSKNWGFHINENVALMFMQESNLDYYKVMWNFMTKHADEVFMKSNDDGRKAVEERDGTYAFLMESASIEYTVERECNLTQIGGLLDSKGYGIATAKGFNFLLSSFYVF